MAEIRVKPGIADPNQTNGFFAYIAYGGPEDRLTVKFLNVHLINPLNGHKERSDMQAQLQRSHGPGILFLRDEIPPKRDMKQWMQTRFASYFNAQQPPPAPALTSEHKDLSL